MKRLPHILSLASVLLDQALVSSAIAMGRFDANGAVPEIDVGIARSSITLLVAGVLILMSRRHGR